MSAPQEERKRLREEIEKRRAEAAEKKKQLEQEPVKPSFTITPKGSSKVSHVSPAIARRETVDKMGGGNGQM